MMPESYLPTREAQLVSFANNFDTKINAEFASLGLSVDQATAFTGLKDAFVNAWNLLQDPNTRTTPNVNLKNTTKEAMVDGPGGIRELVGIIQKNPTTTDQQRAELQITIPDPEPSPVVVPPDPPRLTIVKVSGRMVTVQLRDINNPQSRAKPEGVQGVTLFSYVGDTPSENLDDYTFQGNTGLTEVDITFPLSVAGGAKVWLSAAWYNPRGQNGPASEPTSTHLQIGGPLTEAA